MFCPLLGSIKHFLFGRPTSQVFASGARRLVPARSPLLTSSIHSPIRANFQSSIRGSELIRHRMRSSISFTQTFLAAHRTMRVLRSGRLRSIATRSTLASSPVASSLRTNQTRPLGPRCGPISLTLPTVSSMIRATRTLCSRSKMAAGTMLGTTTAAAFPATERQMRTAIFR